MLNDGHGRHVAHARGVDMCRASLVPAQFLGKDLDLLQSAGNPRRCDSWWWKWESMMADDAWWWLVMVSDGWWRLVVADGSGWWLIIASACCSWWRSWWLWLYDAVVDHTMQGLCFGSTVAQFLPMLDLTHAQNRAAGSETLTVVSFWSEEQQKPAIHVGGYLRILNIWPAVNCQFKIVDYRMLPSCNFDYPTL